ncbi:DUF4097 family beta strand repeat-containing protein [Paenibacillus sp. M1]|uniref:DUF4097 family beta strand repeat-containing protein n=1 Tax=Paenibacillus haidiansis TaxID=1574488 RepID=A0ABU7VYD2_9BACL
MNSKRWSWLAIVLIVIGVAGMAYQKFEFKSEDPYFERKWKLEALESLAVESSYNMEVEFIDSPDGSNYIELSGDLPQDTIDRLESASITGPDVDLDLTEKFKFSFLTIDFQSHKQHLTVALADRGLLEQISFKLGSNNGNLTGLRAKNIELAANSGNLTVSSINAGQLAMKTTSGNLTATDIVGNTEIRIGSGTIKVKNLKGDLAAHGSSGSISVDEAEGNMEASLNSGSIKVNGFTGNGMFKTTSGNVTLNGQRSDSLDISVSSGNVTLDPDPGFKGIYDLKTSSGTVKSPESPMETKDIIKIRTTSGNIKVQ